MPSNIEEIVLTTVLGAVVVIFGFLTKRVVDKFDFLFSSIAEDLKCINRTITEIKLKQERQEVEISFLKKSN